MNAAGFGARVFPATYSDLEILGRIPYSMPGELVVEPDERGKVFDESVFKSHVAKPFEIWRVLFSLVALNNASPPTIIDTPPTDLAKRIKVKITDETRNEVLTKSLATIESLTKDDTLTWEWETPYTIDLSGGFSVSVDSLNFPTGTDNVRVAMTFQGYALIQPNQR